MANKFDFAPTGHWKYHLKTDQFWCSTKAKKMLAEDLKQRAHKIERLKNEAIELAEKLKDVVLNVGAKTSTTGKIFGAVGPIQIADAFEKAGFTVDRKVIVLKDAVKEIGSYKATLKLHKEVTVEVAFEVVAE